MALYDSPLLEEVLFPLPLSVPIFLMSGQLNQSKPNLKCGSFTVLNSSLYSCIVKNVVSASQRKLPPRNHDFLLLHERRKL